jgi:hypothetical protein
MEIADVKSLSFIRNNPLIDAGNADHLLDKYRPISRLSAKLV